MKIGYVCTNFNNSAYTVEAARTLLANDGHQASIVVVDNGSDEKSQALLRELAAAQPAVHVIFSAENVGYFRGLNLGIRFLRDTDPAIEWMVVGNNDIEFHADFGDKLEANAARWRNFPVVSPDIVTLDGSHQNPHVIANISKFREFMYNVYFANYHLGMFVQRLAMTFRGASDRHDEEQWQTAQPIYQGHGSCYLIGPAFFERFEELWAPTFLMSEEFFLAKQLMDVGMRVYYDPAIQIVHHWHGSLEKLPSRRRWEISKAAHIEYRKHVKLIGGWKFGA
jgi:GT2 family glycosyltransferase